MTDDIQIWDSHVHLFPPEIYRNFERYAPRDAYFAALAQPCGGKGTIQAWADVQEALACADAAGVTGMVMQGWYWNDVGLMRMHNDYMAEIIRKYPRRMRAFISVNPKFGGAAIGEIERCVRLGFCGIGELGPGGNGYDFEDPEFIEVIECAHKYRLPVCIHCGEAVGHDYPGRDHTPLEPLLRVIRAYPQVTFILAHLGGGLPFYGLGRHAHGRMPHVYYDTAANPLLYHISSLRAVITMAGADHLLFGSDFPLLLYPSECRTADMRLLIEDIEAHAGLGESERRMVMGANLLRILS